MGLGTPFLKGPGNLIRMFCFESRFCPGRAGSCGESWDGGDPSSFSSSSTREDMGKLASPSAKVSLPSESWALVSGEEMEFDSVVARRYRLSKVAAEKPCWEVKRE